MLNNFKFFILLMLLPIFNCALLARSNFCCKTCQREAKESYFDVNDDFDFTNDHTQERPDYRLNIGDIMIISIYGEKDTLREVVVDPRGMISYLFIDSIPALGKTIKEIREDLSEKLVKYYRHIVLSISPIKLQPEYFAISGEVRAPGRKPIVGKPTILSAICTSGGFTTRIFRDQLMDLCDLKHSFLARRGEYIPVDFEKLIRFGDLSQNIELENGDYIHIPSSEIKQVFVIGEVLSPHVIDYVHSMSLVAAIAEAGDVTERASSRVLVLRGSLSCPTRYLVDYNRIIKGCACNFSLEPGDIVYVPHRRLTRLREILQDAAYTFVSIAAFEAGEEAYVKIHPHAEGDFDD